MKILKRNGYLYRVCRKQDAFFSINFNDFRNASSASFRNMQLENHIR